MEMQIADITPELAARYLGANTRNRPMVPARVTQHAAAMSRGEWACNGDAIRIGDDGVLLDGQHRLAAVIKSGVTIKSVVVIGLSVDVFKTIDGGAKRSSADDLAMSGTKNANAIAASAKLLHKYKTFGAPFFGTAGTDPTRSQVLDAVSANPELHDCARWVYGHTFCKRAPGPSISVFCRVVFIRHNEQKGADFFDLLESGAGLADGSPILALRNRLTDDAISKTKLTARYKAALMFKAFSLFCDDATVKTLRVRTEGSCAEKDIFKL